MTEVPAHEILSRLFTVIVKEAEANPALAKKLLAAFPETIVATFEKPKRSAATFDPASYHAVNILRTHGEAALRGKLEQIKAVKDLQAVAKASGLVLSGTSAKAKAKRGEVIDGVIEAARHYIEQRDAAAA